MKFPRIEYKPFELNSDEQLARAKSFRTFMTKRRSIREFSTKPVERKLLEQLIATAGSAPSGANKQPWRFVVVTNPDIKKQIRQAAEKEEALNYNQRFPEAWLEDLAPLATDANKPFLQDAPALIVVFKIDYEFDSDGQKKKHYYVNESVGIATGFLLTAIQNAGLVTVTHTPNPMGFLQKILRRPKNEKPYMLLPVGYPAKGATVPQIERKSIEEISIFVD